MKKFLPILLCLLISMFALARATKLPRVIGADAKAVIKETNQEQTGPDGDENTDPASNDDETTTDDNGSDDSGDDDSGDDEGADEGDADGGE